MDDEIASELLTFFSALADEERLAVAGIIARGPASIDEIGDATGTRSQDVLRHLGMLERAGIATRVGDGPSWRLDVEHLRERRRLLLARQRTGPGGTEDSTTAERRVLETFFDGERLRDIPVAREKKLVVLRWLAGRFEPGERYDERAVNATLKRHHPDSATLRRALVDYGLMRREAGVYWRVEDEPA